MVLPKTHPAFPRSYCFRKSAIDLAKDQSQYFAHWLMSQTPMVPPRTHLWSSQNLENLDIIQLIESNVILECLSILGIKAAVSAIFRHNQCSEHCFILN